MGNGSPIDVGRRGSGDKLYTGVGGGWNPEGVGDCGGGAGIGCYVNGLWRDFDVDKTACKMGMAVYPVFHRPYLLPPPLFKILIC